MVLGGPHIIRVRVFMLFSQLHLYALGTLESSRYATFRGKRNCNVLFHNCLSSTENIKKDSSDIKEDSSFETYKYHPFVLNPNLLL